MAYCSTCRSSTCCCSRPGIVEQILSLFFTAVLLFIAMAFFMFLLPGLAVNFLLHGSTQDIGGFLKASASEPSTWIISGIFWVFVTYWNVFRDANKPTLWQIINNWLFPPPAAPAAPPAALSPTRPPASTAVTTASHSTVVSQHAPVSTSAPVATGAVSSAPRATTTPAKPAVAPATVPSKPSVSVVAPVAAKDPVVSKPVVQASPSVAPSAPRVATGPFGLYMGMKPEVLRAPLQTEGTLRTYASLPQGHSLFNQYRLWFSPRQGLFRVVAAKSGISLHDGNYGLMASFRLILSKYEQLYGAYTLLDQTMTDGYTKFTSITASWDASTGAKLPPSVISLRVRVERTSDHKGEVCATYSYANAAACDSEPIENQAVHEDAFL